MIVAWLSLAWLTIGLIGLVPGAFIGWLVGQIPVKRGWSIFLIVAVSVALSLTASKTFSAAGYSLEHHVNLLPVFLPPIVAQLLLGRFIANHWNKPSYLDSSN